MDYQLSYNIITNELQKSTNDTVDINQDTNDEDPVDCCVVFVNYIIILNTIN